MVVILKTLLILTIQLMLVSDTFGQWFYLQPYPTGNILQSVKFVDSTLGCAVGRNGTILRTTDGGATWDNSSSGTTKDLWSVHFVGDSGWIVGVGGRIIRTTDRGLTWDLRSSSTTKWLYGVFFVNAHEGWVVGDSGLVLHTVNGGLDWSIQNSGTNRRLTALFFLNSSVGVAVGDGGLILRTTNGGATWSSTAGGTTLNLFSVFFLNQNIGFIGGIVAMLRTSDGGTTWQSLPGIPFVVYSFSFFDSLNGWACGSFARALNTTDGGVTWLDRGSLVTNDPPYLYSIATVGSNRLVAVGGPQAILTSIDRGAHWVNLFVRSTAQYHDAFFVTPDVGWVMSTSELLKTTNGGRTWTNQFPGFSRFQEMTFVSANVGWIAAFENGIYRTSDGGVAWTRQGSGVINSAISIFFADSTHGWALGEGHIVRTSDGGANWTVTFQIPSGHNLSSIRFVDSIVGWATGSEPLGGGGSQGIIYKSLDGGLTWFLQARSELQTITDSYFASTQRGAVCGNLGVCATTNGGTTWVRSAITGGPNQYMSVWFVNPDTGWVVGTEGRILKTVDGGISWLAQGSGTSSILKSICFVDGNTGWAAGWDGIILKTENGGVTAVHHQPAEAPTQTMLHQNYPNPFNPTTTIKFQIPRFSFVILKVFDLLGREVATLVNEEMEAGSYEQTFDGNNLASGIYFYHLTASGFSQTKKLVLLR